MRLFLDTEFNGFGGKLMSLALVPEDDSRPAFYREIEMRDQLEPWVRENVVPHLIMIPCSHHDFQQALAQYLREVGECVIIANWPDDIRYFCESLITGPGERVSMLHNMKFELDWGIEYESAVPHMALHDARAIKERYLKRESKYQPVKPLYTTPPQHTTACYKCGTDIMNAPGIGPFCPNKECDVVDATSGNTIDIQT